MRVAVLVGMMVVATASAMAEERPSDRAESAATRAESAANRSEAAAKRVEDAAARLERLVDTLERQFEGGQQRRRKR